MSSSARKNAASSSKSGIKLESNISLYSPIISSNTHEILDCMMSNSFDGLAAFEGPATVEGSATGWCWVTSSACRLSRCRLWQLHGSEYRWGLLVWLLVRQLPRASLIGRTLTHGTRRSQLLILSQHLALKYNQNEQIRQKIKRKVHTIYYSI